jgi:hypothetical protein
MFAAALTGLQAVVTPVRAGTTCRIHLRGADPFDDGLRTRVANAERCAIRAGRTALARKRALFQDAHAETAETAARSEVGDAAAHGGLGDTIVPTDAEATARAEVSEVNLPIAARCVAAPGRPIRRGPWELGVDRTTGRRCWGLVGALKPQARMSSPSKASFRPKSPRLPKSSALSPRVTAASAGPIDARAAVETHRPTRASEIPTGDVGKPAKTLPVNLGQSPVAAAGAISKPSELDQAELPPFELRFAQAAEPGLSGTSAALVAIDTDPARISSGNLLEAVVALLPFQGRPAVFLIVFSSMLALISTFYVLVIGSLKLVRSRSHGERARAIGVTPQRHLATRWRTGFPDEQA